MFAPKKGDWNCGDCGTYNFARRYDCFGCGQPKQSTNRKHMPISDSQTIGYWFNNWISPSLSSYFYSWFNMSQESTIPDSSKLTKPLPDENRKKYKLDEIHPKLDHLTRYCQLITDFSEFNDDEIDPAINRYLNWSGRTSTDKQVIFIWASHMLLPVKYREWRDSWENNRNTMSQGSNFRPPYLQLSLRQDEYPAECRRDTQFFYDDKQMLIKELKRITINHLEFCHRIKQANLVNLVLNSSIEQLKLVLDDFKCFLQLGRTPAGDNYCPTLIIDLIWHSMMMTYNGYRKLCYQFELIDENGSVLPHCLIENETRHKERYQEFLECFEKFHHRLPLDVKDLAFDVNNRTGFADLKNELAKAHINYSKLPRYLDDYDGKC